MSVFQLTGGGTYVQQPPAGAYIISFPTNGTIKNISGTAITVTYYLIGGGGGGGAGIDTEPAGGGFGVWPGFFRPDRAGPGSGRARAGPGFGPPKLPELLRLSFTPVRAFAILKRTNTDSGVCEINAHLIGALQLQSGPRPPEVQCCLLCCISLCATSVRLFRSPKIPPSTGQH